MRLTSLLLAALLLPATPSLADGFLSSSFSPETIAPLLVMDRQWVPYPDYHDRDGWDRLTGPNKAVYIRRGEGVLDYSWQPNLATDYLEYERSGNRLIMEDANWRNTNNLAVLVTAELAEGRGRFLDQIINGVFFQCERTSWVMSAHLSAQHSGRALPDHTDQVIDLFSGDISGLLAWTWYFLGDEFDKVDPVISRRVRDEVTRRTIIPYRTEDRFWWTGFTPTGKTINNWNPWCNFNVLQCLLLMEDDRQLLASDVYRTMTSVDKFLDYITKDGACDEGPSYWKYAAGKLYDYLKVLHLGTGGGVDFFAEPRIRNMGEYITRSAVGTDWVVNFADAGANMSNDIPLTFRYGSDVGSKEMMRYASYFVSKGSGAVSHGRDIFRVLESLRYYKALKNGRTDFSVPDVTEYPETQFYFLRSRGGLFLAAKGGHNNESHNHNDVGTFSLYYNDMPVFIDVGVGTYSRETFSGGRYGIWSMRSGYHNLPTINGAEQRNGQRFRASDVVFDHKQKRLSLDIAGAYPDGSGIGSWVREYTLKDKSVVISDQFSITNPAEPDLIHFMLWGDVDISVPGAVTVDVEGNVMRLTYDPEVFTAELETISLEDPKFTGVWGDSIFRLTLNARSRTAAGTYSYTITAL